MKVATPEIVRSGLEESVDESSKERYGGSADQTSVMGPPLPTSSRHYRAHTEVRDCVVWLVED